MTIEIWDLHFHIWDVSKNTISGHDSTQLFAPNDKLVYSWREYERDFDLIGTGYVHKGGVFVEALSACHIGLSGFKFSEACIAETSWALGQLEQSKKQYMLVSSAPLEYPEIGSILSKLAENPTVRGIRQIINYNPSWPRNEKLGNLLENRHWKRPTGSWATTDCVMTSS